MHYKTHPENLIGFGHANWAVFTRNFGAWGLDGVQLMVDFTAVFPANTGQGYTLMMSLKGYCLATAVNGRAVCDLKHYAV